MKPSYAPATPDSFPFKQTLSLDPLIKFWRSVPATDNECIASEYAARIQRELDKTPELSGPLSDLTLIEKHKELVDALMVAIFPPASWETDISAAIGPFDLRAFYSTPRFKTMNLFSDGRIPANANLSKDELLLGKVLKGYDAILRRFYDAEMTLEYPIISSIINPATGLDQYLHWRFDPRFIEVHSRGKIKQLTQRDRGRILEHSSDFRILYEILPPSNFEFYGFGLFQAVDVTDQEALSSLRLALIQRDTLVSGEGFATLQHKLRILFKRPDLVLGMAALPGTHRDLMRLGRKIGNSFVLDDACRQKCYDVSGSAYERALRDGSLVVINDLRSDACQSPVEREILSQGMRNLVIAPLIYHDQVIGVLELASKNPGDLNSVNTLKLREVLPLFAMATNRALEEFNTKVQAVIKEKFTAIHPSVEWRFQKAAREHLLNLQTTGTNELESIVFKDVYPLFGLTDIRDSSVHRNSAIGSDLVEQLKNAGEVIHQARTKRPLPILDDLHHRIGKRIERVSAGLNSGDETAIIEFLRNDVETLFPHLTQYDKNVYEAIQSYRNALDPDLKVVYRKRRDLEESVTELNDAISSALEEEEADAQQMFPHYFEKYKTDGVDHTIYIGAEITADKPFDLLYLRNLRLWQLMTMCRVARKVSLLKDRLKVPLEASHLILVQHTPMAIRFRIDEKKFDVDGSYNVRYEIMKKRIDKAMVHGKAERLTQPGKIAIVYSHPKEESEYREYIDFLQARGVLNDDIEPLDLGEVQGVQGLKALRVGVRMDGDTPTPMTEEKLTNAVNAMIQAALKA